MNIRRDASSIEKRSVVLLLSPQSTDIAAVTAWACARQLAVVRCAKNDVALREGATGVPLLVVGDCGSGSADLTFLRRLREIRPSLPIVCIGERSRAARFLRCGADDFIARPYEPAELDCRLDRCVFPRATPEAPPTEAVCNGPFCVDTGTGNVMVDGRPLRIQRASNAVLAHLLRHRDRWVSARELNTVVLSSPGSDPAAARNKIAAIRKALIQATGSDWIETCRTLGYRLTGEQTGERQRQQRGSVQ